MCRWVEASGKHLGCTWEAFRNQLPGTSFQEPASRNQLSGTSRSRNQLSGTAASRNQLSGTSFQEPAFRNQLPGTSFRSRVQVLSSDPELRS